MPLSDQSAAQMRSFERLPAGAMGHTGERFEAQPTFTGRVCVAVKEERWLAKGEKNGEGD